MPKNRKSDAQAGIETGLDIVLALLYAPGTSDMPAEPIQGITRLQKLLFLLWKEGQYSEVIPNLYNFKAYDFGPCVDDLYDDLDFAEDIQLITVDEVPTGNDFEGADEESFMSDFGFRMINRSTRRDFALTENGIEAAEELYETLGDEQKARIQSIKRRYNSMPFFDLLRYVYRKYPKFAKKSVLSL